MSGKKKGGKALGAARKPPRSRASTYSIDIQCQKVKAPGWTLCAGRGSCGLVPSSLHARAEGASTRPAGGIRCTAFGRSRGCKVAHLPESRPPGRLHPETWTSHFEGASPWFTVTSIAFDRHRKAKSGADGQREPAAMTANGCERIGLPRPREVIPSAVSAHLGAPPAHAFPKLKRKDGGQRCHTHAILVFDEPVCGPVLIGAGRFRGYGVCRAV